MRAYQGGNADAAEALLDHLTPGLYRFFLAQASTRAQADDLLQETWLRLHRVRHTHRPGEPVLPWVYAIARHVRVDAYRRYARRARREVAVEHLPEPVAPPPRNERELALQPCLERLPESQREVVTMLKFTGMSVEEVARAMGTTAGAVKQKAHRAYLSLRQCLEAGA